MRLLTLCTLFVFMSTPACKCGDNLKPAVDAGGAVDSGDAADDGGAVIDADPGMIMDADPGTIIDADPSTITDADPNTIIDADPSTVIDADPSTITDADPSTIIDADPSTIIDADPSTITDADPSTITDADPSTIIDADPSTITDADPSTITDADPSTIIDADPSTITDADPSTITDADPSTIIDADPSTLADASTVDVDAGPGPTPVVVINEVVAYPVDDWSRSDGGGPAYQGVAGTGLISSRDQYIELRNNGTTAVDLTMWTLEIVDQSPTTTNLGIHADIAFTSGSTIGALQPGHLVVIGDPIGFVSTDSFIKLVDGTGRIVDDVEIGGLAAARDAERDGIGDGAPSSNENGYARGSFAASIARPAGAPDTDNDIADFVKMVGTPVAENTPPAPPVELVAPTVMATTSGSNARVSSLPWVEFSETVDAANIDDSVVTITAGGVQLVDVVFNFEVHDTIMYISPIGRLPYDSDIVVLVRGGPFGVTDLAGNPMDTDYMFAFHTEAAAANPGSILISEIVTTPLQDWGNSAGGDGIPFSAVPGNGAVDSTDEYVELVCLQPGSTNMSGYSIVLYSGPSLIGPTTATTPLSGGIGIEIAVWGTGAGINDIRSGDRIVIGNLRSSLRFDYYLELRDGSGALVDAVEVGGNAASEDTGGDGVDNGAPGIGLDGRSSLLSDEAIQRPFSLPDTGNDTADFEYSSASPGS